MITQLWLLCVTAILLPLKVEGIVHRSTKVARDFGSGGIFNEPVHFYQGRWPYAAALYYLYNNRITHVAGGTVVSNRAIITGELD